MRFMLLVISSVILTPIFGQFSEGHRIYLNKQIHFINESVHGLLVAHRLVEGYNQEVNKYVDLPSYKVNNFGNKDLPSDIFGETDQWFYQKPPNKLYNELLVDARRKNFPLKSWPLVSQLRSLTKFVNNDRILLGDAMAKERLNQLVTIQKIFLGLENMSSYYQDFNSHIEAFEKALLQPYHNVTGLNPEQKQVYTALVELHYDIKTAIRFIRKDDRSSLGQVLSKIEKEANWLRACIQELPIPEEQATLQEIGSQMEDVREVIATYFKGIQLPDEYSMYGSGYYSYNVKLLTLINRYGNGYVSELNTFFKESDWRVIHFLEEAHHIRVIYPEKIPREAVTQKVTSVNEVAVPEIAAAPPPEVVKEPLNIVVEKPAPLPVNIVASQVIVVDSVVFDLELFDHRIKDGDLISINVNGEWLFDGISLEKEVRHLRLKVNPSGNNYILIRADNVGWRPPNTVGVRYISNGIAENFFFIKDLQPYQAIEIKYRLR